MSNVDDKNNSKIKSSKKYQNEHLWTRNINKSLRELGMDYIDSRGKCRPARKMKTPCESTCRYECTLNFNYDERLKIHKLFWTLTNLEKDQFYGKFVNRIEPKRRLRRYTMDESRKSFSYIYHFPLNDKRLQVCKIFFSSTLCVANDRIYRYFNNLNKN